MSAGSKAVFLGYASQDADGSRKIGDALGTVGVGVWFSRFARSFGFRVLRSALKLARGVAR